MLGLRVQGREAHGPLSGLRGRDERPSAQRSRLDRGRGLSGHHHRENLSMEKDTVAYMDHKEKAVAYYKQKFNCAQGIFAAYAVEHGVEEALALRLGTNFGGGARKGELCGAVSGALMVLGLLYGHSERGDAAAKARAYTLAEEYMNRFIREKELFRVLCPEIIRSAVAILDELLAEQDSKENGK